MPPPSKVLAHWHWVVLAALLIAEFIVLDGLVSRHYAWVYPRWNDQIQYLTEAYTGYEYLKIHGFVPGLWQTLVNPSAQGTLHDFFAVLVFTVAGPSRSAALSVNLFYLLAWQAALFLAVIKTTQSRSLAFASVGLLLALNLPWWGGPGSVVDFRLDWMACCAMGVALALALCTEGFRSRRWSLLFGASVGFALLTRFLTGAYIAPIFATLFVWCLAGDQRWHRSGNLLLAALVAFVLAAPCFWLNRDWVYNYYLVGHFTGPESAIRSPHMGIIRSLGWLFQSWWNLHIGARCAWLIFGATLYLAIQTLVRRRQNQGLVITTATATTSGWATLGAVFFLVPALVLTLHSQKSELVLSILLPATVVLVLGLWQGLAARPVPASLGWAVLIIGGVIAGRALSVPAGDSAFLVSARKVNVLADYLYKTQGGARLEYPRIGVDQVTDSLDGQIMRVLCYERHKVWVQFMMTLPTGIMEDKPEVLMERLAQSDFIFLTDQMPGEGHWPYDRQMRRLYPQLKAWCEHNLKPVEAFSLFGRQMMLYQRRTWPEKPTAVSPDTLRPDSTTNPSLDSSFRVALLFFSILALLPLGAYVAARRLAGTGPRIQTAGRVILLFVLGLFAASPFLTDRAVGTGEAYNYSLALADAVLQMRAGEIPPLAGQTEFAFNSRIHPLRTAPYLFYLGGAIDAATRHQLSFWQLQNLSLAFSLMAAIYACYAGLRWGVSCPRIPAIALSVFYGFCPALLGAAYWFDLFMTVHAAPFLPLALAACLRQARHPQPGHDVWLAAALAATWLAHPPVAIWLTLCTGLVRTVIFFGRPSWRELRQMAAAGILVFLLAGFVFASVFTLNLIGESVDLTAYLQQMWSIIHAAFPGCLLPVPNHRNDLCNLQLGYSHWLLLGLAILSLWFTRPVHSSKPGASWLARLSLALSALFLLALSLPVPVLTPWLWKHLPDFVSLLTNIWPMQRLYLVATALIIFAAAEPLRAALTQRGRFIALGLLGLGLVWTVYQSWPFLQRGFSDRWVETTTRQSHLSTNLNLTVTSYAYLDLPANFVNGVMDPFLEFRLLLPGGKEVSAFQPEALAAAPVVAQGVLPWPESSAPPVLLRLEPHRRYLLNFTFHTPPVTGYLQIIGPSLARTYQFPAAGNPRGFGMGPDYRHSLSLWTSENRSEEVALRFVADPALPSALAFADFTLHAIDPASQPVVVHSLLPLHYSVRAPEVGCMLETCRRYLPGYKAIVNGHSVTPVRSSEGQLMVPVPKGRSNVEIRYVGSPLVRYAFGVSASTWLFLTFALSGSILGVSWPRAFGALSAAIQRATQWLWRRKRLAISLGSAVLAGLTGWYLFTFWQTANTTGPLQVQFRLPPLVTVQGRAEPLVVTGRTGAGDFAYIRYVDAEHVQFGFDHWAVGGVTSELIPLDDSEIHTLEVRLGSLYPAATDHRWEGTPAPVRDLRKNRMVLLLDGRVVLSADFPAHPSTNAEITVGLNRIGGSLCKDRFSGDILSVQRLSPAHP